MSEQTASLPASEEDGRAFGGSMAHDLLVSAAVLLLSVAGIIFTQQLKTWFGARVTPITAMTFAGLASLWLFSMAGVAIGHAMKKFPIKAIAEFPVLGWVSLTSLVACLAVPGFVEAIAAVDFLSITTPVLAFAGISVADRLVDLSKTSWRVAITAVFVFVGTYVGSALLAQFGLSVTG